MRNEEFPTTHPRNTHICTQINTDTHRKHRLCGLWAISTRSEEFAAEETAVEEDEGDKGDDRDQSEWE
jgi:hypothetical protein